MGVVRNTKGSNTSRKSGSIKGLMWNIIFMYMDVWVYSCLYVYIYDLINYILNSLVFHNLIYIWMLQLNMLIKRSFTSIWFLTLFNWTIVYSMNLCSHSSNSLFLFFSYDQLLFQIVFFFLIWLIKCTSNKNSFYLSSFSS